jgi:hypothetical protein
MYSNTKILRRYPAPFTLKILAELSTGKHTKSKLCKRFAIAPAKDYTLELHKKLKISILLGFLKNMV